MVAGGDQAASRSPPCNGGFRHEGGGPLTLVFAVEPTKDLAFGEGTFAHTRHHLKHRRDSTGANRTAPDHTPITHRRSVR
jgi:hypothetical protein